MEKIAKNFELDGHLFELLVNVCLDRMNDQSYQLRAKANDRLQNTEDPDDLTTKCKMVDSHRTLVKLSGVEDSESEVKIKFFWCGGKYDVRNRDVSK